MTNVECRCDGQIWDDEVSLRETIRFAAARNCSTRG
jgi:hypothetical protein